MQKFQRFGGAMMTPVLLFAFVGLVLSLTIILGNPAIVGDIAQEGTTWTKIISIIADGAWTVFNQIEVLFVIGVCVGLAKAEKGRAAMTGAMIYLTWNYFIGGILTNFGDSLGIDISEVGSGTGLKLIAGIVTLDTGLIGAIAIAACSVYIHNRFFDKKLPDFLGIFQGSTFVYIVGFASMMVLAVLTVFVWPPIQRAIGSLQGFMLHSGPFGVWIYTFLERILIPTGLHHFIWQPFMLGPAVIDEGIKIAWINGLPSFANSSDPLSVLFPIGGFALHGSSKVFGSLGVAVAIYMTAKPEKKQKVKAILIPVTLTAVLTGITEPLEFTFLFVAPMLFGLHALLAACLATCTYLVGVRGDFGDGLLAFLSTNWIPLFKNHWLTYVWQILVGLGFSCIWFFTFRFFILKFDLPTPGREKDSDEIKLYTKKDYQQKLEDAKKNGIKINPFTQKAMQYIDALGGQDNLKELNNCATRLRVTVKDASLLYKEEHFKEIGAYGVVVRGDAIQVIIGGDVVMIRSQMDELVDKVLDDSSITLGTPLDEKIDNDLGK